MQPDQSLKITRRGRSRYRIVIADNASPSTRHGARELSMFLRKMTGADLPVVSDSSPMTPFEIILGDNAHLRKLDLDTDIDFDNLGDEGYVIRTKGTLLVIAGGELRGNMYGVYGLLEDHLGCRWFTPEISSIPERDRLVIPHIDETVIPVIAYREPYVWEAFDGDWAARNRMNRNSKSGGLKLRHGGKVEWVPEMFVHTFEKLVPPDEYFDEHPEYFSLVDGRRRKNRSQLCCTNEEVIGIITEGVLDAFRENPQAYVLSVSQNDWDNHCECKKCRELAESEGSQMAPVLQMVNRVAEAADKKFPDKVISTLAYQWTRRAPKTIRPRKNVVVRLCTIECCFSHPLETCDSPENRDFVRDLREWAQITSRIWIWNYVTSFAQYLVPFPNLRVRDDNIRLFVRNNVTAVFQQDVYTTPNGELSGLSGYLNAKLMWNPDYDEDTAIDEFLAGVYGKAAQPIRAYIDMLHDKVAAVNIHMGVWQGTDAEYLTDDILDSADSLWNEAEAAVDTYGERMRVRTARLSSDYAIIARDKNRGDALLIDNENLKLTVNPQFTARVNRFCNIAQQAGIVRLREYDLTVNEFREKLKQTVKPRTLNLKKPAKRKMNKTVPGLTCRYYEGSWRKLPLFSNLKHKKKWTTERIELPDDLNGEQFAIIFGGYITVPSDGVYTFYTRSASGSKLLIGSTVVVNNDGNHSVHERSGYCALKAGMHPITVTYYTRGKGTELEVFYKGPGIVKQIIPGKVLFR